MWDKKYSEELLARRQKAINGGGEKRIEKQHQAGKLTARERVEKLFDPNSFVHVIRNTHTSFFLCLILEMGFAH